MENVMEDPGELVKFSVTVVNNEIVAAVVKSIAACGVNFVAGAVLIVTGRNLMNDVADYMPFVLSAWSAFWAQDRDFAGIEKISSNVLMIVG